MAQKKQHMWFTMTIYTLMLLGNSGSAAPTASFRKTCHNCPISPLDAASRNVCFSQQHATSCGKNNSKEESSTSGDPSDQNFDNSVI